MNYFLLQGKGESFSVNQFSTEHELIECLTKYFTDSPVVFLDSIPSDLDYFDYGNLIVIRGKIIKPKAVEIVKTFEID